MAIGQASETPSETGKTGSRFRGLTLFTVLAAFALVVLGGVVRVTESGLGCPDWPLCQGRLIPPLETSAIIEYSHRLVASALLGP
ncbi:MAG: COX15/CtaA family protein, partial [Chloroflexi bacterium]|nr:COX15/CtaA family protein [Chloroflexota bacterium]